jgi:hypothetical protein
MHKFIHNPQLEHVIYCGVMEQTQQGVDSVLNFFYFKICSQFGMQILCLLEEH